MIKSFDAVRSLLARLLRRAANALKSAPPWPQNASIGPEPMIVLDPFLSDFISADIRSGEQSTIVLGSTDDASK